MIRRDFLKGAAAPAALALAPRPSEPARPAVPPGQPEPLMAHVADLNGVATLIRFWEPGAPDRCRLCPAGTCSASQVEGKAVAYCVTVCDDPSLFGRTDVGVFWFSSHHLESV